MMQVIYKAEQYMYMHVGIMIMSNGGLLLSEGIVGTAERQC